MPNSRWAGIWPAGSRGFQPRPRRGAHLTVVEAPCNWPGRSRRAGILPAGLRGFQPRHRRGRRQVCMDKFIKFC
jgi:hypothetical protein